jgi:hypothetical protein
MSHHSVNTTCAHHTSLPSQPTPSDLSELLVDALQVRRTLPFAEVIRSLAAMTQVAPLLALVR